MTHQGHWVVKTREERFWARVDRSGECWLWTGAKHANGYGKLVVDGKYVLAHRFAYELLVGTPPPRLDHRHTCPKNCVNPRHLRPANQKQNMENHTGPQRNSTSGIRGVSWDRQRRKWMAKVKHYGVTINAGRFDRISDAEAVVVAKRLELFTHNDLDRLVVDS